MLTLLLRLLLDVRVATVVGSAVAGHPELADRLVAVARRESQLSLVGIHAIDSQHRPAPPETCSAGPGWSTRGAHGMMAAYAMPYAWRPLRCLPWLLDIPVVSAVIAARRASSWRCRAAARCRSWLTVGV